MRAAHFWKLHFEVDHLAFSFLKPIKVMKRNCTFLLFFWQIFLMGSFEISEAWLVISSIYYYYYYSQGGTLSMCYTIGHFIDIL